jgi:xanthine dehydrogenase YagS FAD-binding subunit
VIEYARPGSLEEALSLLAGEGAVAMGGATDLAGQLDRGLRSPSLLVDLQAAGLGEISADGDGLVIGATVTLADLAESELVPDYAAVATAAREAASPLLRNIGTVAGNLCQHTRCWYYRGEEWHCWLGGGDTCYAQIGDHRKHNLQPGDCISAHPSDLAPALAASGATVRVRSADGERELPLLELYRRPTADNRSLLALAPGELVTHLRLPAPPSASVYLRAGERQAFSFPLVGVAAARNGAGVRVVAAGVANIPRELDPADPLTDLPGNPQSEWKRTVLTTLTDRALVEIGGDALLRDAALHREMFAGER